MNRDDVIRMAHEADCLDEQHYGSVWANKLERFANLVAAAEREPLLNALEMLMNEMEWVNEQLSLMPDDLAEAQSNALKVIAKARDTNERR
jgi:hypothetical protein